MKKYPLLLLPTDKTSVLALYNNKLYYSENGHLTDDWINQHIYLIDPSAEIKDEDYYVDLVGGQILKSYFDMENQRDCKKIIASTDKSITPNSWIDISKSMFIIDHYNTTGKMPDVGLEIKEEYSAALNEDICIEMVIKTNSDGSVIIKPIEEKKPTMEETREFLGLPPIEQKVDVEKIAEYSSERQEATYTPQHKITYKHGYIDGYNQAIKDNAKLGTMDNNCAHDIDKLYNKIGDYKGDYCKICKGVY